jgi:hypothetical protein
MPHLLVDISSHGFGHVGQTAPVVNALTRLIPELRITIRTAAPHTLLRQRFQCEFTHIPVAFDFGLSMASAVDVQIAESAAAYRDFHADWEDKVRREALTMRALSPDLLLADIPYLSLAAAQHAGIPSVGLCSLNWADIYRHYCTQHHFDPHIHMQIQDAYQSALCFLQPQPSMPMPWLANTRQIGPIARIGNSHRASITERLRLTSPAQRLILIGMGGMEFRLPMEDWPRIPSVHWLVPAVWNVSREDISSFEDLGLSFSDVLASCDAVLTKPGYGTFAEAACTGIPVLSVTRPDWPETPYLVNWLKQHGVCLEVQRSMLVSGELQEPLQQIWSSPRPAAPAPSGAEEAAQYLCSLLSN